MKSLPLLMQPPLVSAVLRNVDPKTMTRRTRGLEQVNEVPDEWKLLGLGRDSQTNKFGAVFQNIEIPELGTGINCPYGEVGARLWVRENYALGKGYDGVKASDIPNWFSLKIWREADGPKPDWAGKTRPSIFMPRWACRLELEVNEIRVERLQDITSEDAKLEGLKSITKDNGRTIKYGIPDHDGLPGTDDLGWRWDEWCADPRLAFANLINRINGDGAWEANPWVWMIGFRKIEVRNVLV